MKKVGKRVKKQIKRQAGRQARRHNQQFIKNEAAFFTPIIKRSHSQRGNITVQQIANDTNLSRQTFYAHFQNINEALIKLEKDLLRDYQTYLKEAIQDLPEDAYDHNKKVLTECFFFIMKRKSLFSQICKDHVSQGIIYKMMLVTYPSIQVSWLPADAAAPSIDSELVDKYIRLTVGIICAWVNATGCDLKSINRYLMQFLRLTTNATRHCRI